MVQPFTLITIAYVQYLSLSTLRLTMLKTIQAGRVIPRRLIVVYGRINEQSMSARFRGVCESSED